MHEITHEEQASWPRETVIRLEPPFVDARGEIQPLVETMMRSALMISSKKGATRGNHYHKTDWHYCYVVSGLMEYWHRPAAAVDPPERLLVPAGTMIFSPPLVEHAMHFLEDTVFLTLSRNPRDQSSYESDLVRVSLV